MLAISAAVKSRPRWRNTIGSARFPMRGNITQGRSQTPAKSFNRLKSHENFSLAGQEECAKPGAGTAPLHRDRRSPWWWGYAVLADPDCRLMEVNGRVCAWFTTVKSARCN